MPTVRASGTITSTASEQNLINNSLNGEYVCAVDLSNMQVGDTITLRGYRKVLSGGSAKLYVEQEFSGAQDPALACSIPVPAPYGVQFTLQRDAGTDRQYPYSVEQI